MSIVDAFRESKRANFEFYTSFKATQRMSHSHCGDESHSHGHGDSPHSHSPPPDSIPGDSLYSKIDLDRVRCMNERVEGMARSIIKPWDQRLDSENVLFCQDGVSDSRFLKVMPMSS